MTQNIDYNKTDVLIVGGGPAGLAAGIRLKSLEPDLDVCVIEKGPHAGSHNLSGAVLEIAAFANVLESVGIDWKTDEKVQKVLGKPIEYDDILFMLGKQFSMSIEPFVKIANKFGLGFGQLLHKGDYSVSISRLTALLAEIAEEKGVEVLFDFAAEDIVYDPASSMVRGVKLVDQGIDKEGEKQPNYLEGEIVEAKFVILAEGCDGLLTEKFVEKARLQRERPQMYSLGVKELIKVSEEQYKEFKAERVVHALGYPIWTPIVGPGMFGGGIAYAGHDDHISVGMIVGLDWKYSDFNTQDALVRFKEHKFIKRFIEGGQVVEAGAKMIPEGGWYAIPRDPQTKAIGKGNCLICGDSAGLVNMLKIKGLHNAIESGYIAAEAIRASFDKPTETASYYTKQLDASNVGIEMRAGRNFRQTVAKFGPLFGMPISVLGDLLPKWDVEEDYKEMRKAKYRLKPKAKFDKDTFTAVAATEHREEQPSHLIIRDRSICDEKCVPAFGAPCITFCPAGVYETIGEEVKPANPSNCLHCKTCQRKCPFDNIRWTVPEGGGGPRYGRM